MKSVRVTPFRSWNTEPILIVGLSRVSSEHSFELVNDWPGILSFP